MGTIADVKIKYSGLFDAQAFYQSIVDYLDSHGFEMKEKEFKYKDKNGVIGLETTIEFEKEYEKDIKVEGKIELKIEGMKDVVVKKENMSRKLQQADKVEVKIKAEYKDEYGKDIKGELNKILLEIYKNTLAKKHFKNIEKKAKDEISELVKEIKRLLNLHAYVY